jgi:uncharacterized protein (DUF362 family)
MTPSKSVSTNSAGFATASEVAVCHSATSCYPAAPFHPPEPYPELASLWPAGVMVDRSNQVYAMVRECFRQLGFDRDNENGRSWNPLAGLISPGDRVVLKPNWVSETHHLNDSWEQIITHGAVLRPILDYVQLALKGQGSIAIADGPMLNSSFDRIVKQTGVGAITDHHRSVRNALPIAVIDLRKVLFVTKGDVVVDRRPLPGDPAGAATIDLGAASAHYGGPGEGRYYGADYDAVEVNERHSGERHQYLLSTTALSADVIIDVPKLKTHAKVGATLALKGIVGVNAERNWLPHHTQGTPEQGGDQFATSGLRQRAEFALVRAFEQASLALPAAVPPLFRLAKTVGKRMFGRSESTVRGGGWYGNDTLWRTVLDINRALSYADSVGRLHDTPTKRRLVVVDGIVAGEGMGPVFADPRPCGLVVAGYNPVAVDTVCVELMGFDFRRIPYLDQAFVLTTFPLVRFSPSEIRVVSNVSAWQGSLETIRNANPFEFTPPKGWMGRIERLRPRAAAVGS